MLKPGRDEDPQQHVVARRIHAGLDQALAPRLGQNRPAVDASAVIADPKRDAVALPGSGEEDAPFRRLPRRDPLVGHLDAMIGRIPDEVQQRLADLVQDRAIQLDLLAFHVEPDPLAEIARQVPNQPGEPIEDLADRSHPRRNDLALHRGHQAGDAIAYLAERRVGTGERQHAKPVLGDHELADLLHQGVQPAQVDPDLAAARHALAFTARLLERDRLDVARGLERGADRLVGRARREPEEEASVELLALELRGGRPEATHGPQRLGAPEDQRRPSATHDRIGSDSDLHRPRWHRLGALLPARTARAGTAGGRRLRDALGGGGVQLGEEAFIHRLGARGSELHRLGQRVHRAEHQLEHPGPCRDPSLPETVEQVLHPMSQLGHAGVAHRRGHPLDRMDGPEQPADRLGRRRLPLPLEQQQVAGAQVLAALREEQRRVLRNVHRVSPGRAGRPRARERAGTA